MIIGRQRGYMGTTDAVITAMVVAMAGAVMIKHKLHSGVVPTWLSWLSFCYVG